MERRYAGCPVVVIAGRPNTGKSTLFNRLSGTRKAITDPTPGVTRDPVEVECELVEGKPILLVDTGGFSLDKGVFDELVARKAFEAFDKADLILLLIDVNELTGEDEELVARLRGRASKVILVANKVDGEKRENLSHELSRLGLGRPIPVSAEHGRNVDELEEAMLARLDFSRVQALPEGEGPLRIAILGKPNTGKSTLLNRLIGAEKAIVSDVAGTTRDVIAGEFERGGKKVVVLDTAGIRRKSKVTEDVEYYSVNRAIRSVADCHVVLLMIDAQEGLTEQDKKIAAQAAEKGRGMVFVLNKWDLVPKEKDAVKKAEERLRFLFGHLAWVPIVEISAMKGKGLDKLLDLALEIGEQLFRRIETGPLNQALKDWMEEYPPPVGRDTKFKIRYMTQVGVDPIRFLMFVSRPQAASRHYVSYIKNKIRKDLGFTMVPVDIELKGSRTPFEELKRNR